MRFSELVMEGVPFWEFRELGFRERLGRGGEGFEGGRCACVFFSLGEQVCM